MRIRFDGESAFLALFVAVAVVAIVKAVGFVYPAGLLPLVVGVPTLGLGIMALVAHWMRRDSDAPREPVPGEPVPVPGDGGPAKTRREAATIAWVVGGVVLMWGIGILATIPVFVFLYATFVGRIAWTRSACLGLGVGAAVYVLFVMALGLQLAPGWVWQLA